MYIQGTSIKQNISTVVGSKTHHVLKYVFKYIHSLCLVAVCQLALKF